ncbi:peptidylprolyl isomerase [Bordetella genomosp. 8]|nr:peptidylprolyl isomerase [Bordetella genomosp. 8]
MKIQNYGWLAATALCMICAGPAQAADAAKPAGRTSSASNAADGSDTTVVARMGTVEVQRGEVQAMLNALAPQARAQVKANRSLLDNMVRGRLAEKALLQQAQSQNWAQRPEVKAQIEAATREIVFRSYLASVSTVPADYPSDKELSAAYERTKSNWVEPAMYRVAQIFLAAPINDAAAVARARRQADDVARQAQGPKADFTTLMKKYSQDPGAQQGGDTGMIPLAQLLPEMRPVVATMRKGQVSAPVQSLQGFHILKLVDERPQQAATFAQVRDRLRLGMRQERQQQAAQAYLQGLLDKQSVTVDGAALGAVLDATPR